MEHKTDFLVVGSGLAGMSYALKVAEFGSVILLSKTTLDETNTALAQGGIASVTYAPDNLEKHVQDTLIAGDGLCNEKIVRIVVNEAPEQIQSLIEWGAHFDKDPDGKFDLNREGGHSERRILHYKDSTGAEIMRALLARVKSHPNITIMENSFALDLITQHHLGRPVFRGNPDIECYGAYTYDIGHNRVDTILSKVTMLATGGSGYIYQTTTNPPIATGDGIAMAYRAKAYVENVEFYQFHPTSLYNPGERPSFLISEAVRGLGGILKTQDGAEFMNKYDPRGSLASRDIVARAIDTEMKNRGEDFVLLDCTHIDPLNFEAHFPNIYKKCLSIGYDMHKVPIPVTPAVHYFCGGVRTNENGQTTIRNLYASGEVACTGLHGANRLASNSLLEALVFSNRAAIDSTRKISALKFQEGIPPWNDEGTRNPDEMVLITQSTKELQEIMTSYVGIVRTNARMKRALDRIYILYRETEDLYSQSKVSVKLCELRNAIKVAYLIVKHARQRKESRGLHYNLDYPKKNRVV